MNRKVEDNLAFLLNAAGLLVSLQFFVMLFEQLQRFAGFVVGLFR